MNKGFRIRSIFGRFHSIQTAMTVSFSVLLLIAMLFFLILSLAHTRTAVFNNSIEFQTVIVGQVNDQIDSYITYMENISNIAAKNSDVLDYLYQENPSKEEIADWNMRVTELYQNVMESREDISNIAAIGTNGRYVINGGSQQLSPYIDVQGLGWYQAALRSESGIAVSSSHVQNAIQDSYRWVITLSRALINPQTGAREGVFLIDLNYHAISRLCNIDSGSGKGYMFILDETGNIVYHPKQQLLYGGLLYENISAIMNSDANYLIEKTDKGEIIYTKSRSDKTGWTVVGATYTAELIADNRQTQLRYLTVALLLLLAVIAVSYIISREIARPIRQLKTAMALVERGEFEKANVDMINNNEIGRLSQSFNRMTERIDSLLKENTREQKLKRKNEMRALQAQINPHFLYNTLDSIIWMSEVGRNEEVVLMTSALARLFRQSISNNKEQVSIREELEYVKNYLTIQRMRYKDKLDYIIDVEPEILNAQIIKFALQPLVENAIYHGLKYKDSKGLLSIRGYRREDRIVIEICDDGAGMDEAALAGIFETKPGKRSKTNGVGAANVQTRLKLYYGEGYGISYTSTLGKGTTAKVVIPAGEEDQHETLP